MSTQAFIDALRGCLPNTSVRAEYQGHRHGITGNAGTLVRDWDYLTSEVERLTAERDRWQRIAGRAADALVEARASAELAKKNRYTALLDAEQALSERDCALNQQGEGGAER